MSKSTRTLLRTFLSASLAIFATPAAQGLNPVEVPLNGADSAPTGLHDFDFLIGRWNVHHRRLKERLANSHDWIEFSGTTLAQSVMAGAANIDDNVLEFPGETYRAVSLRSFDAASRLWSIWWLDGRSPQGPLDSPVKGRFQGGVGTFYADDTLRGKPIRVRFVWSDITPTSARWAQSFSPDGELSWEINWTMDFERARDPLGEP